MNITEIARALGKGKAVKRKGWGFSVIRQSGSGRILINQEEPESLIFMDTDLLADDWEIVEENSHLQKQPHVSKKYILQKHLPGVNAGHSFSPVSALAYAFIDNKKGIHIELANDLVENNPDWFRVEEKSPARLAFEEYCKIPRLTYAEINESLWNTAWYAAEEYFKSQK